MAPADVTEVVPTSRPAANRRTLLTGGAAVLLLGGCTASPTAVPSTGSPTQVSVTPGSTVSATASGSSTPTAVTARDLPKGEPREVVVTTPGGERLVDADLIAAGLDDDGILAPPAGVAGWYDEKGWPKPGFPGAAILAGHINTRATGPDTFARLPEVRPGARVTVHYSSGDEVEFIVTRSKAVPKKQTPKDDSIWDAGNPRPLLRLITCDPTTPVRGGHYVGNWVVWASPKA